MKRFMRSGIGFIEYCIEDEDLDEEQTDPKRTLYIDYVEAEMPGEGLGKILLSKFIKKVKRQYNLKAITLIASDCKGTPLSALEKFYKGFGFKEMNRSKYGIEFQLNI